MLLEQEKKLLINSFWITKFIVWLHNWFIIFNCQHIFYSFKKTHNNYGSALLTHSALVIALEILNELFFNDKNLISPSIIKLKKFTWVSNGISCYWWTYSNNFKILWKIWKAAEKIWNKFLEKFGFFHTNIQNATSFSFYDIIIPRFSRINFTILCYILFHLTYTRSCFCFLCGLKRVSNPHIFLF